MGHLSVQIVHAFIRWIKVKVLRMHVSEDSHLFRRH